ncbi:MAG TPA: prepilin-type N-terminal cleavage/methylation domain-containing protein, partial [Halanaerobiales bacterium]|nr:prepilin-type N-terminal cleavage/methylation domain-containing protein [Halanaerobiales bacterium]
MMGLIEGKSGFTLIELLVVVVILGLVITAVLNINLGGFKFLLLNRDRIKLQDEARLISTNLERQIRKSSGIDNDKSDRYNLYLEN